MLASLWCSQVHVTMSLVLSMVHRDTASAAAALFDPNKQTPTLARFLQGHLRSGSLRDHFIFVSPLNY